MPTPQRLPIVNSDDAVWGDILRQYLMKEHYNDDTDNSVNGGHQKITIRGGTTAAGTAPIKIGTGSVMSSLEVGALEYDTDFLYFTIQTGPVRKKIALINDSGGATGDMYYRDVNGKLVKVAIGSTGQSLRVSGGVPTWSSADDTYTTATKTADYTVSASDTVIFANATSGNVTVTLPAASGLTGYKFFIKRIDNTTNTCTVSRSGSDTIDGQTSFTIDQQYTSLMVVSNGSNWYIL